VHESLNVATQRANAVRLGHSFSAIGVTAAVPPAIQRKLTVGAPGERIKRRKISQPRR